MDFFWDWICGWDFRPNMINTPQHLRQLQHSLQPEAPFPPLLLLPRLHPHCMFMVVHQCESMQHLSQHVKSDCNICRAMGPLPLSPRSPLDSSLQAPKWAPNAQTEHHETYTLDQPLVKKTGGKLPTIYSSELLHKPHELWGISSGISMYIPHKP